MTVPPPKYPRIPHFASSTATTPDDIALSAVARSELLKTEVCVEEKLDGMNVALWIEDGIPHVATRGGSESSDRSGERGRVRAWASAHADALAAGLDEQRVLYAEWLRRRHGVAYEQLPGHLIGIDVLDRPSSCFVDVDERDAVLLKMGIPGPPVLYRGVLGSAKLLETLFGRSAFADERAEGLIIRALQGESRRIAKLVDPAWSSVGSMPWNGENQIAARHGRGIRSKPIRA